MKRLMSILTLILCWCATSAIQANIELSQSEKRLYADLKGKVCVYVAANPSTGYSWFWDEASTSRGVRLVQRQSVVSAKGRSVQVTAHQKIISSSKLIGSGHVEQWCFQLPRWMQVAATQAKIGMTYARPWEAPTLSQLKVFTVITRKS